MGSVSANDEHPSGLTWGEKVQYVYLLRVPILVGATLFALPFVSLYIFPQLLANLFVLELWNIFWTMMASVILAWSILVVFRVVLLNGLERFGVRQALTQDKISWRALVCSESLIVPILVGTVFSNAQAENAKTILMRLGIAGASILAAHVVGFVALLAAVFLSPQYRIPAQERFPGFAWMRNLLKLAYECQFTSPEVRERWGNRFKALPMAFRAGYFDAHTGLPYPGQLLTFMLLICTFTLYLVVGRLKQARLGNEFGVPAVAYVILLLILANWILAITAFFLDRYRIPLLSALLVLIVVGNLAPQSDHYFALRPGSPAMPVDPESVLTAPSRIVRDDAHPRGRVTVIATAGGGIQAAAWTAQVLTGLERELRERSADKPVHFADSIALISSVSGGAVGTLFFVNRFESGPARKGFQVPDSELRAIVEAAEKPGLGEVAWALVYADFWRIFFPYTKTSNERRIDRGWALEEVWRKSGKIEATLNDWRQGVLEGWRPAVIFNATLVETGEPLLLATTDVKRSQASERDRRTFSEMYRNHDISVVTAVRLAATFPFVTPAARANLEEPKYHVVDGGYYDNYGIDSMLEWLREALEPTPADKRPDILIIQIRSFPSDAAAKGKTKGWFYQTIAPFKALMSVRTTGQLVRDRDALSSFAAEWSARGVRVRLATFEFPGTDAPLSWQMSPAQIQAIRDQWHDRIYGPENQDWLEVNCFFRPGSLECAGFPEAGKKGPW